MEDVQFFECEEKSASHKSFSESMSKEYEKERQAVLRSRQLGEDMMVEMVRLKNRNSKLNKIFYKYHLSPMVTNFFRRF